MFKEISKNLEFSSPVNVVWLRRNLRIHDNPVITEAAKDGLPVLLVFIFDKAILSNLPRNDARVDFIHRTIHQLQSTLQSYKSSVLVAHGFPDEILEKLFKSIQINGLFFAEDFEPEAIRRDEKIKVMAQDAGVPTHITLDHVIFHPNDIMNRQGKPYLVYTPYYRAWKEKFVQNLDFIPKQYPNKASFINANFDTPTLNALGFEACSIDLPPIEIDLDRMEKYKSIRDFPALDGPSRLGLHLRFGTISPLLLARKALQTQDDTFLKQLIWREFFIQIMYHFPASMNGAFKPAYRNMPWKYNEAHFSQWKNGQTGVPIVDAGMRELAATGTMHNRVRMIAASWLTKNLLIDWRLGERYFAEKLLDFELASNVGNWQWVAGTGVDAAPYFRIFNPFTQAKKFDPQGEYIHKWVPEIASFNYPQPMVDYKKSRETCLEFYKTYVTK